MVINDLMHTSVPGAQPLHSRKIVCNKSRISASCSDPRFRGLLECLQEGLDPGQMAVEVQNIAAQADVHGAVVEKILNGLCAADDEN